MRSLIDMPPWAWVTIMLLTDVVAVSLLMSHEQKQMRKQLRAERKMMQAENDARIELLAEKRFREMKLDEQMQKIRR